MGKLDGKVAIVTGAARGLGRAYARRLGSLFRDDSAVKEARVLRAPQFHRVGEGEITEVVRRDQPVLDQFPCLG